MVSQLRDRRRKIDVTPSGLRLSGNKHKIFIVNKLRPFHTLWYIEQKPYKKSRPKGGFFYMKPVTLIVR